MISVSWAPLRYTMSEALAWTDTGNADGQSGTRRGGVATNDVNLPFIAGTAHTAVKLLDALYVETLVDGQADKQLLGVPFMAKTSLMLTMADL